jgi:hypothetical protein
MNEVEVTVRVARDAAARQSAFDAWRAAVPAAHSRGERAAVIVAGALAPLNAPAAVRVESVAGCFCCVGQVALGVALTRLLRARPDRLLLLIASDVHLERVRRLLGEARFAMLRPLH